MRHTRVLSVLTLFFCSSLVDAQPSITDDAIVRAVRSLGFHALYSEARTGGTLLGLPAGDAGRLLFASGTGLDEVERDALLLALLFRTRDDPPARERLRATLFLRVELLSDWSLIAELLSPPATDGVDVSTLRWVHLDLARRILLAIEAPLRGTARSAAGYEPAAIALANSVGAKDSDAEATAGESDLVLAETFREIARLSRHPDVVEALNLAARELLTN